MLSLTLILPIPARSISPNARRGQSKYAAIRKSRIVKQHRTRAHLLMLAEIGKQPQVRHMHPAGYALRHFFPTLRFRDEDNADGACKAYRDGIADALQIDDKNFCKIALSTRAKDAQNPRVEISILFVPQIKTIPQPKK
jgi:crossover junction endodeoxyribonuclease RusA